MSRPFAGAQRYVTAALRLKSPKESLAADAKARLAVANVATMLNSDTHTKDRSVYDPEDVDPFHREEQQLATNTDFTGESPLDYSPDSSSFSSPELPSPRSLMASISEMVDSPGYLYHSIRRVGPPTQTSFPEEEDEKRQSLAENKEVQVKINRVFELARSGSMEGEEMRSLVEELEEYYSRPPSQDGEALTHSPSQSANSNMKIAIVKSSPPVTHPINALGICNATRNQVSRSPSKVSERPSRIPRLQSCVSGSGNLATYSNGRKTPIPPRNGLGPRSFSDPNFWCKSDRSPMVVHARSASVKSLIPRRVEVSKSIKLCDLVKLDMTLDLTLSLPSPQNSRFSTSTAAPSLKSNGIKRFKPALAALTRYKPPPTLTPISEKKFRSPERRFGFVPLLPKMDNRGRSQDRSRIPRKSPSNAQANSATSDLHVQETRASQVLVPIVSGRWSTDWDDVLHQIGNDSEQDSLKMALVPYTTPKDSFASSPSMVTMLPRGSAQARQNSDKSANKAQRRIGRFFSGINWSLPLLSNSRLPSRACTPQPPITTKCEDHNSTMSHGEPTSRMPIPIKKSAKCQVLLPSILGVLDGSVELAGGRRNRGAVRMFSIASRLSRTNSKRTAASCDTMPQMTNSANHSSHSNHATPTTPAGDSPNLGSLLGRFPEPPGHPAP